MTAERITESRAVVIEGTGANRIIRVITPGMGSSGLYATEVLKESVKDSIFDTGLHLYVDHPTMSEDQERPERSVRDLAAVATGPAVWNEAAQAVDQPIKIFPHYNWIGDVSEAIGMSIRCAAEVSERQIEGRSVRVIDKLTEAFSVDFVTKAGRGGKVLAAMESARPKINEALSDQRQDGLTQAARDLYGAQDRYVYVITYDESAKFAIIAISDRDDTSKLIKQSYTVGEDDLSVSLTGDAVEVRRVTNYVPTAQRAAESQEGQTVEITEAERKALDDKIAEADKRAADAEAKATAAEAKRVEAEAKIAERDRLDAAQARVAEKIGTSLDHLPAAVKRRVTAESLRSLPIKDGALDLTALDAQVDEAIKDEKAYLQETRVGVVQGHGDTGGAVDGKASEAAIKRIRFAGRN